LGDLPDFSKDTQPAPSSFNYTKIAPIKLQKTACNCNIFIAIAARYCCRASPVKVNLLPDKLTLTLRQ
jgi:hypothetical protein